MSEEKKITVALAGNPNCGKTTLFNSLTGATAYVGNWPGVTVEKRSGVYKGKKGVRIEVIDLPGIYSLSPYTSEEVVSRNYILDEHPDVVINVVDATNLERNLYLTTQLLEMDVPVVVALNMEDLLKKEGASIDEEKLSKVLGVPVIGISALKQNNLSGLMEKAYEASKEKRLGKSVVNDPSLTEIFAKAVAIYQKREIANPLFHAIKALENDEIEMKANAEAYNEVTALKEGDERDYEADLADARYVHISNECAPLMKRKASEEKKTDKAPRLTLSDEVDKVLTNKWAGIPIFIVILLFIFHLVFSEDFLYLQAMGAFGEGIVVPDLGDSAWTGFFISESGLASPGVLIMNLLNGFTGWLQGLVAEGFAAIAAPEWVSSLICDGVLGGIFAVLGFLPQILLLFLFFSILEDSGYMARVAFLLDRIFRRFGLSGRAFLPMIMGFGCSVPAIMNTRTLGTDNEKIQTIRVIPFFSCGAKLPILTAVSGGIAIMFGMPYVDLITLSMYLLGMIVALVSVLAMHMTTRREKVPPFIMELPAYHLPQPRALMIHLYDKMKHFLKKAFTIIFATTVLIWLLQHLSWNWTYLSDEGSSSSILASLGQFMQPLFTPLGFGAQLNSLGWVFAVAVVTGLMAKENAVGTLGTLAVSIGALASIEGVGDDMMLATMIQATGLTAGGAIAFIIFNMLTIPCFAAVATAKSELPKGSFKWTILFWLVVSYIVAMAFYLMIDYVWTIAIFVPLFILGLVGLFLYDRYKTKKENAGCGSPS